MSEGVEEIGALAFYNCPKLSNIVIPETVRGIEGYAFGGCSSLTSIRIPPASVGIGNNIFTGCKNLASVYVCWMTQVESIHAKAFDEIGNTECILYIPHREDNFYYENQAFSPFRMYGCIREYDAAEVDGLYLLPSAKEKSRISMNGQRLEAPAKGLNIVKYSDGRVRKEFVR